jgi:hypothetical protein
MPSADRLNQSLRRQPLLVVLRPRSPLAAEPQLQRLQALGLSHVEIAWRAGWMRWRWGQRWAISSRPGRCCVGASGCSQ